MIYEYTVNGEKVNLPQSRDEWTSEHYKILFSSDEFRAIKTGSEDDEEEDNYSHFESDEYDADDEIHWEIYSKAPTAHLIDEMDSEDDEISRQIEENEHAMLMNMIDSQDADAQYLNDLIQRQILDDLLEQQAQQAFDDSQRQQEIDDEYARRLYGEDPYGENY